MLLLTTCRYLKVVDRRMTTAIKLILAQAFVSGATSLVHQLVRNRVLHRRPFPERGPSTSRLHLGSQLLLKLLILTDAHASALAVGGFGALGAQGTRVTRRRRKLGLLAGHHGDALATRTGHPHTRKVQGEIMLRKKRPNLWPGTSDNGHALRRPLGNPGAGHVSQVDIELPQARGFLQLLGQQLYRLMLRLIRRPDHHLSDDCAVQSHGKVLFEAVEGFGTAFAAVAPVVILDRDTPIRRDVLLIRCPLGPPSGSGSVSCMIICVMVSMTSCRGGVWSRQGVLRSSQHCHRSTSFRTKPSAFGACAGLPPIQVQGRFETALSHQRQPGVLHNRLRGRAQFLGRQAHGLAQRMAEQVQGVLDPAGAEQGGESKTARSCLAPKPPVCSAKATVRSSRVLSTLWVISRIRKLNRVP